MNSDINDWIVKQNGQMVIWMDEHVIFKHVHILLVIDKWLKKWMNDVKKWTD